MNVSHARTLVLAGAIVWAAAAGRLAGAGAGAGGTAPDAAPPPRLSQTGLYADAARLAIDARNRPFSPQYPLWSDGAVKRRWVRLPEGAVIDARDADRWDFPVGTRFWKEFAFAGRRVETRYLVKTREDHWAFASYVWSDDQRDAVLAPADGVADVAEVAPGRQHSIPSIEECRSCHDSARTEVLGFTALQLSTDRDPHAPHAEPLTPDMLTLRTLAAEGRLHRTPGATDAPRIAARDPRERAVLGYLSTNCGGCHNRESAIASLGLYLKYRLAEPDGCVPDAIRTSFDARGHWAVPAVPEEASRLVAPGVPARSALLYRATSRRPSSQMPPVGTVVPDRAALELLSAWISSVEMPSASPGCPAGARADGH